jgi:GNAT superfamily N-acetyltransferase
MAMEIKMQSFICECENIVKDKFFYIPKLLSTCKVEIFNEFQVTKSLYTSSMFNICWMNQVNPIYLESSLNKIINYFFPNPFALWMGPSSSPKQVEEILHKKGFVREANEIGMTLELGKFEDDNKLSDFTEIKEVFDENGMLNFIEVLENYDSFVREYYIKVARDLGFLKENPYRFFYLDIDGKTACIASLFFKNGVCGIFDMLTHDDFRKQGNASKMMKYLLLYAKNQGAVQIGLTASSFEAVSIYKKLGFIEMGNYECYEYKRRL